MVRHKTPAPPKTKSSRKRKQMSLRDLDLSKALRTIRDAKAERMYGKPQIKLLVPTAEPSPLPRNHIVEDVSLVDGVQMATIALASPLVQSEKAHAFEEDCMALTIQGDVVQGDQVTVNGDINVINITINLYKTNK